MTDNKGKVKVTPAQAKRLIKKARNNRASEQYPESIDVIKALVKDVDKLIKRVAKLERNEKVIVGRINVLMGKKILKDRGYKG